MTLGTNKQTSQLYFGEKGEPSVNYKLLYIITNYCTLKTIYFQSFRTLESDVLTCQCDFMSFVWNMIYEDKHAEVKCKKNGQFFSMEGSKQLTEQDVKGMGCSK